MDFAFDDTQQTIARLAGEVLARESDLDSVWKLLGQAGLLALTVPERLGGDGLGPAEVAVLVAEAGRLAVTLPALETLVLGVLPVARHGTVDQQDRLLDEVTSGNRVLTAALRADVRMSEEDTVSGRAIGVRYAAEAHRILVPVGQDVLLVDPVAPGVRLVGTESASGVPESTMTLEGVQAERLAGAADDLRRLALAGACALGDGLVAGALDLTAGHVRTREQFGKPLATFQAVAQRIADAYVSARTLHLATWTACWRLGAGLDADQDLDIAAYWLAEEAPSVMHACHHLHGGLGVDASYPLHRYYSATKDLVRLVGGVEHRLARLGERITG
jgi:3-oxo-4-pregnene-20-carboxyl-CoA dehydrogenase alpha subunit